MSEPRRLEPLEIKDWEARFQQPMSPHEMIELERRLARVVGSYFFIQPGLQFQREAFVAGRLGLLSGASSVKLLPDDRPDCELVVSSDVRRYEITEADEPGRRRGDEYRLALEDSDPKPVDDPAEVVLARAAMVPQMLRDAAARKSLRDYGNDCGLVIYLNLSEYDWHRKEIEAAMPEAVSVACFKFREVIVLWKDRLYPFARLGA